MQYPLTGAICDCPFVGTGVSTVLHQYFPDG